MLSEDTPRWALEQAVLTRICSQASLRYHDDSIRLVKAVQMRQKGKTYTEISRALKISPYRARKILKPWIDGVAKQSQVRQQFSH